MTKKLTGIAIRESSRSPMQELSAVDISLQQGLLGDFRGRPGKRQVTVLSLEDWTSACAELDPALPWTQRRANLCVSGISFSSNDVGKILHIGEVQLQVTRETDPCTRMDEACAGLMQALTPDWRGGVCCKVIKEGRIQIGDEVELG